MNEYINVLKKYAVFEGRARRREYWMFALFNFIAMMVFYVPMTLGAMQGSETLLMAGTVLFGIYSLATFIPNLAVTVRRLHDTGRSGWFILLAMIPFLGLIVFVFLCFDSQPGSNQYGENPKGQ